MMAGGIDDLLSGFDPRSSAQRATERIKNLREKVAKPLPQIRGKTIDGVLYLRAEDVLAALESGNQGASPLAEKLRSATGTPA